MWQKIPYIPSEIFRECAVDRPPRQDTPLRPPTGRAGRSSRVVVEGMSAGAQGKEGRLQGGGGIRIRINDGFMYLPN